jgi:8-oxo-dGTP diphosphatase
MQRIALQCPEHRKELDIPHEVVGALIIRSQMILLGQRSATRAFYPNVWDVFGGHVEPGEQHHQTFVRELQEELGITPTRWTYLETLVLSLPLQGNEPSDQITLHLYLVTDWTGRPANHQPDEHSAIGWFSLAQATQLELAHPTYPVLFARYLASDPGR